MILMNDFQAEPRELRQAMADAAARVLDSGWYVLGREVAAFEQAWAQRCGVAHCVGVGNGMDAIELALRVLGIGAGDEVITTPMTAFATVLAVMRAGATPVLADIDPLSGLLDPDSVARCISPRTRALVLVHLYGQMRDMDRWTALCGSHGIELIEDCAQAHLARWNGRTAGALGTLGAFSFYPTKNLGAPGDAGAVVTGSAALAGQLAQLRNYGQSERYVHPMLGMNSRLDELQAALLSVRLGWLDRFTQRRRSIAARYRERLDSRVVTLLAAPQAEEAHVHHLFVLRCARRDALLMHLKAMGVQALIHYPIPVHHQKPCEGLRHDPEGLVHAEAHAAECLSIPCHPQMSDDQVDAVVAAVNSFPDKG